ncbi:hypothetical protein LN040_16345 [Desulfovibrio subterraneus]|uniref:hypothetical protein n=1 Tax=Desulfovibrio subterraneus TaxID=2718620 RepID=UPI0022B85F8F|nr:hypothetical protein [Desulfovibrio subterraneus]WBF67264.1 hypothetical protein LN040_16345 [Desulfovibrio subterraneus]
MSSVNILQSSFNGGELSPLMDARVDQSRYGNGCSLLRNMFVHPHGPASRRPGLRYAGGCKFHERRARLIPFAFSVDQSYALECGHLYMRVWKDGGQVVREDGTPVEVATPWTEEDLEGLKFCQSADVMYIVSPAHAPRKIMRHAHDDWRVAGLVFGSGVIKPAGLAGKAVGASGTREYSYVVTAVNKDTEEESLPSEPVRVQAASSLNVDDRIELSWDLPEGNYEYRIYKCWNDSESYGFVGRASSGSWVDRGATPDFDDGPPEIRNPFTEEGSYPSVVQFFQQRLCFASSRQKPQTVWTSQSGNYENLNVSNPLRADDAVTATIAADRVNAIRWMLPTKELLIGTVGGEWIMSGVNGEPLSPMSVAFQRQTVRGSADIMPIVIGSTVLFVQRCGKVVREFRYSLDVDGYDAGDLTVLSEHMTRDSMVREWAYQQSPHSIVWCVLENGALVAFTYEREHKVVGWHRHDTDGVFESICTIPGLGGDELWCIVRREIEGVPRRYVERLASYFAGGGMRDAFFVDSGLTYEGAPQDEMVGLEHLEGKTVSILTDGWVHPDRVVTGGRVVLDRAASLVHVGLGFVSDLSPMKPEVPLRDGTAQGRTKRISRLWVRLHESLGLKVGPDASRLREVVFRKGSDALGQAIPLFTGDKVAEFDAGYSPDAGILVRQDYPLPMTVLALIAQLEVGDR